MLMCWAAGQVQREQWWEGAEALGLEPHWKHVLWPLAPVPACPRAASPAGRLEPGQRPCQHSVTGLKVAPWSGEGALVCPPDPGGPLHAEQAAGSLGRAFAQELDSRVLVRYGGSGQAVAGMGPMAAISVLYMVRTLGLCIYP